MEMSNPIVAPFVKWAGGKRQLLPQIRERMPQHYNRYFEPFVGGGAVLFDLQPEHALINDINKALINAYKIICENPEEFLRAVKQLDNEMQQNGKEYYYAKREDYNDKLMRAEYDVELAALFVFINKHCFNGLYRVNGKGLFNVPYNNSRRTSVDMGQGVDHIGGAAQQLLDVRHAARHDRHTRGRAVRRGRRPQHHARTCDAP